MEELTNTEKYLLPSNVKLDINEALDEFQKILDITINTLYDNGIISDTVKRALLGVIDGTIGVLKTAVNQL